MRPPDFYTCVGGCNPQSGCTRLADTCPEPGLIDMIGTRAIECQTDGTWKLLTVNEEYAKRVSKMFSCSSDGRSIIDSQTSSVLMMCDPNDTCDHQYMSEPTVCSPTAFVYGCSINQTNLFGGMTCTSSGIKCTPNERFTLSQEYPCYMQCNATGDDYVYSEPYRCVPTENAYIDRICRDGAVYQVRSDQGTSQLIEHCILGCADGMCKATQLIPCTPGEVKSDISEACPLTCQHGVFMRAPWCGKIDVVGYNNQSKYIAYTALSLLPSTVFDHLQRSPLIMSWSPSVWENGGLGFYMPSVQSGFPYNYMSVATFDDQKNFEGQGYDETYATIHEFFHNYALQPLNKTMPDTSQMDTVELIKEMSLYPQDYMEKIGCIYNDKNGTFSYKDQPVTGYNSETAEYIPCAEDFADSAAWYVMHACELRAKSPDRYEYFKDTVFKGREYIPAAGCGGN